MAIFPDKMLKVDELTLESIAAKFTYLHTQVQLLHWQTTNGTQHQALGELYEYVYDQKDVVVEQLMGCMNRRVKLFKIAPISDMPVMQIVTEILTFSEQLRTWAQEEKYYGVISISEDIYGFVSRMKYRLTMS